LSGSDPGVTIFYGPDVQRTGMRWVCLLLITAALVCTAVPGTGAVALSIDASPKDPLIGDIVTINGTITGVKTIAVYLFLTGPNLDARGVTLENLNIPAGRGLFTTAPVHMEDGSWSYIWDTSVILGTLRPGNYTVYVVSSPVDRLQFSEGGFASTDIEFHPAAVPEAETPLPPVLPFIALGIAGVLFCVAGRSRK
jgi:hypothetical protein